MAVEITKYKVVQGKTYTLFGDGSETEQYYHTIRQLADLFLQRCRDEKMLRSQVQKMGKRSLLVGRSGKDLDPSLTSFIRKTLRDSLSVYTRGVDEHLRDLPFRQRFDETLRTKEEQYHLSMLEIELLNRIYREPFKRSDYKFALFPHCLRDFRPDCRSIPGDIEGTCRGCTKDCFINLGSLLLKRYHINPYISVEMDQDSLFGELKAEHPSIGALGIACIPELVRAMRLCIRLDIPAVGIPLDANRCARWMNKTHESSFSLEELENLLR